jgi:hypothetical protein
MSETSTVPTENFPELRDALRANGVSLTEVTYTVECTCHVCGARWSSEASLSRPLDPGWWQCYMCGTEGGDHAHT